MFKKKTETYSFQEFFEMRRNNELVVERPVVYDNLIKAGITVGMYLLIMEGSKAILCAIPLNSISTTTVACLSTIVAKQSKMDVFNNIVVDASNKLLAAVCFGGTIVESIQGGGTNQKKFTSALTKYAIVYGGGLLIISLLDQIKNFA